MIVGRVIGWIFLIAAVAVLVRDISAWLGTGDFVMITAGELWFTLDNGSLNLVQAVTQRYVLPSLWDPVIVTILLWPALLVLGVPGIILTWVFRRRPRKTGIFRS
ncbi:MAG: hypothetical protein CL566_10600 [Alphaproteobacteria bacterium]|nr:hypothetical protein [Alphaproteobacteria bacterium]